jgi:CcmD family protein
MTIHPATPSDALRIPPQQRPEADGASRPASAPDTSVYDTVWTERGEIPEKQAEGFEAVMVADGKIYVVLAVVLIIWFGLLYFLVRTDRRIAQLERQVDTDISEDVNSP